MSYHYQAKTDAEIEQTAAAILAMFPGRRLGLAVQVSPKAAAVRAIKLRLLCPDALRRLFPGG